MERQSLGLDEIAEIKACYGGFSAAYNALDPGFCYATFYRAMQGKRADAATLKTIRDLHKLMRDTVKHELSLLNEDERRSIYVRHQGYANAVTLIPWLNDAEEVLRGKPLDARVLAVVRSILLPDKNSTCNLAQI